MVLYLFYDNDNPLIVQSINKYMIYSENDLLTLS